MILAVRLQTKQTAGKGRGPAGHRHANGRYLTANAPLALERPREFDTCSL
jgi:hypothetical protein